MVGVEGLDSRTAVLRSLRGSGNTPDSHSLPRRFESLTSEKKKAHRLQESMDLLCLIHNVFIGLLLTKKAAEICFALNKTDKNFENHFEKRYESLEDCYNCGLFFGNGNE